MTPLLLWTGPCLIYCAFLKTVSETSFCHGHIDFVICKIRRITGLKLMIDDCRRAPNFNIYFTSAFTELQMMVMNDISPISDLTSLPFLDFSTYAYKVLFPNIEDFQRSTSRFHAAAPNNRAAVIAGLKDFHTLLCSEPFILNFIHTLEQQPRFNMKDRCNVASLLMVALCERLDYATYILSRLLFNLMKRPQIKTSPHLFLRRTESVAEKFLTNWLTFALYDHVKQVAGKPLYMLYRAIKATIETGPVDSVSYQARYALSEDRLLRQKIDFKVNIQPTIACPTVYVFNLSRH